MDFWRMPLDAAELETVVGEVHILAYRCKGCGYCIEFCPKGVLAEAPDFNDKGYHPPVVTGSAECKDCRFCETVCPEFAIFVSDGARKGLVSADVLPEAGSRRRRRPRREG